MYKPSTKNIEAEVNKLRPDWNVSIDGQEDPDASVLTIYPDAEAHDDVSAYDVYVYAKHVDVYLEGSAWKTFRNLSDAHEIALRLVSVIAAAEELPEGQ